MQKNIKSFPILSSEITPKHLYLTRRDFIKATGLLAGSALLTACGVPADAATAPALAPTFAGEDR